MYAIGSTSAKSSARNSGRCSSGGKHASRKLKRAQILLAADAGAGDEEIARSVGVGGSTVYRTKRRFVEGNLERALSEEPRPGAERKLTGKEEALLVATACAKPPRGRARWTLELLAGEMVKLTEHKSLSHETVRRRLAENDLKPWRKDMWCIPQVDGEYVARMEDVLDLYAEAPDPKRPGRLLRRKPGPAHRRGSASPSRPRRASSNVRLRVSAQRHGQSLRLPRRASSLAQGQSHRPASRSRLRRLHARARRRPLSQCREHPRRPRQPIDPLRRRALPGLPARRGEADFAPARVPLHAQARKLAQHGRDRDRRPARPMPRSPHRHPGDSSPKSPPGNGSEMPPAPASNGCSPPRQGPRQNGPRLSQPLKKS